MQITFLFGILILLITVQVFMMTSTQSQDEYYGIAFGTEAEVGTDGINDVWKLEKHRYTYVANNQTKPEVDLLGLDIIRNVNESVWSYDYVTVTGVSVNQTTIYTFDYNYSYAFNISLSDLINVSYSFTTNLTFDSSAIMFYNWSSLNYYTDSTVGNKTKELPNCTYSNQNILLKLSVSHSTNFTWWFNVTYEFWYWGNQIVTLRFASIEPGNKSLVDNVKSWIFLDTDGDNKLNYVIDWIYGSGVNLYGISNESFTLGGFWNGEWETIWNGIGWKNESGGARGWFGGLTTNTLNITIPDYILNLSLAYNYSVWSLKIETDYDWWDALPDDSEWELGRAIPTFQIAFVGVGLLIVGLIFLMKKEKPCLS